ncbi:glycoside hydrolase family 78 protein [Actinospica durhamensis]|uniref:alpha-L-rhamnosidase n=1 Tax=Actinospica durhamensis TaxID=1508375 RepID=A0A941IPA2_9ACTN|nr:glycoside hydrolase family 78 protein [Actinospica durhamensis]MBR7831763.1 glycoside hydrolase family 78 protein [Actinospica durhamensis]
MSFEHLRSGLGIGVSAPRLSWTLPGHPLIQDAYELEISRGRDGETSCTGRVSGSEQRLVAWPGRPLASRERAGVRVRVWTDGAPSPSEWSEPGVVEAGLLEPCDWVAAPVGAAWPEDAEGTRRPSRVRRDFELTRPISRARLYITAHGLYEAEINGVRVGDDALSPGWTVYPQRLRYYTYDVTERLSLGANTIGGWLGDGWYRGKYGFDGGTRNIYGTDQSLIAQLEVVHDDGSTTVVATDGTWSAAPSPITESGLYEGEIFDARLHDPAWSTPDRPDADAGWTAVAVRQRDVRTLVAPQGPAVRCTEEVAPVSILRRDGGRLLLDFGQNLVGRLRITLDAPADTVVTLRHAEVLEHGELAVRPLREASSTDVYVSDGTGPQTWEPRFTLHGFRYAEIDGWPTAQLDPGAVVARVYHTDMRRTGWFECSDPLVNRLHENVVWSMRGNFVDLPTDCPQRDERLGWTGDIQVFAPTAAFLYDCAGMLDSWLVDVGIEQLPDGTVPWYVPVIPGEPMWTPIQPGAAWGDVSTLTPWLLYQRFGDADLLRRHFETGKKWVDLMDRLAGPTRLWDTGFQLGDWLDPAAPPDDPASGRTDKYLIATAYFAWSARHLARIAQTIGEDLQAHRYKTLADQVASAFRARWAHPDGLMRVDSPTAYALALQFELITSPAARKRAGDRLAELVLADDAKIATGFVGTPLLCDALTEAGHIDVAYSLLLQTQCPSWLYPVTQGATTIWERWDSMRPDGSLNPGGMTSFNHYALGAVADWLHRVVAGLEATSPGYRTIRFRPRPGGRIISAKARHETPYGTAAISWELVADTLNVDVTVPAGCTAELELPGQDPVSLAPGTHHASARISAGTLSPALAGEAC